MYHAQHYNVCVTCMISSNRLVAYEQIILISIITPCIVQQVQLVHCKHGNATKICLTMLPYQFLQPRINTELFNI